MLGELEITAYNTPGHSRGSCVYVVDDAIFSGDTLFAGCCGRCDLEGGSFDEMLVSLRFLANLEGDYRVFPGHEAASTLDQERHDNPYMRAAMRGA